MFRTALRWARHYGVPFAARSGAHSYGGYSASRGLLISLARMNSVRVDRRSMTITVGAGARIREFYAGLAGTGVAAPDRPVPVRGPDRAAARRRIWFHQQAHGPHL